MSLHLKFGDWILNLGILASVSGLLFMGQVIETTAKVAKVSDPVLLAIVGGVVTVVTTIFGGIMTYFLAKIQRQGVVSAVKTEEVKKTLVDSTESANRQLTSIHTLVNANMGAQLTISAVALRRIAELTKHADDIAAAETAEQLLAEHVKKQAVVDRKENTK